MTAFRMFLASLAVAAVATGAVYASSGTNYSDQWGAPSEPNWGVSVQQQSDSLMIDLMVYGNDGRPTWLVASALPQEGASGHDVFAGALYTARGPHFAATFDPLTVAPRYVGDVTFDATDANHARISFSVDGATTVREVTRQTWGHENLAGVYDAIWMLDCDGSYASPIVNWMFTETVATHAEDNTVMLRVALWAVYYEIEHWLRGSYTQSGHLGEIRADLVAPDSGTLTIAGIESTSNGFTAASVTGTVSVTIPETGTFGTVRESCHITNGRLVAVRRP